MKLSAYAFVSYQTTDKLVAGKLKTVLSGCGITSFLAHEDINVSEEWRVKILEEIGKADIFVCLLSNNYFKSSWCVQESGIAAYRKDITIVPLSIDGTIPQGFISNVQSVKIDPESFSIVDMIPGIVKHNFNKGIDLIIEIIAGSKSYRGAEANFQVILPYIPKMKKTQVKTLLEAVVRNGQVHHASLCAHEYIPPLLKSHGRLLEPKDLAYLENVCAQYA